MNDITISAGTWYQEIKSVYFIKSRWMLSIKLKFKLYNKICFEPNSNRIN